MRICVLVHPNARDERVEAREEMYHVYVSAPPVDGKANAAMLRLLADFFRVPKSCILLLRGENVRRKLIEIMGP